MSIGRFLVGMWLLLGSTVALISYDHAKSQQPSCALVEEART